MQISNLTCKQVICIYFYLQISPNTYHSLDIEYAIGSYTPQISQTQEKKHDVVDLEVPFGKQK